MTESTKSDRANRPPRSFRSRDDAARQTAFVAALALYWGGALATQYVAAQLGPRHRLGAWLYRVPATSRFSVGVVMAVTATAGVIALISRGWRWACLPLALVTASLYAALSDAIYPPTELWRWYVAFGSLPADRSAFRLALGIVAATVVLVTAAEPRVRRAVVRTMADLRQPAPVKTSTWPGRAALSVPIRMPLWRNERAKEAAAVPAISPLAPTPDADAPTLPDVGPSLEGSSS